MKNLRKVIFADPDFCKGHEWRHLCSTTLSGKPSKKDCPKGGIVGGCNNLICVNCGGLDKNRKEYQCFKCQSYFFKFRDLDTDKPTCDKCFKELLNIKTADEYQRLTS